MSIDGSITFEYLTVAGVLQPGNLTTGDGNLPELDGAGSMEPALALPLIDGTATGYAGNVADGALLLPLIDTVGAGTAGAELPLFTVAATGIAAALIVGDGTLPLIDGAGSMEPALALPLIDGAATGYAGNVAMGDMTLPLMTVAADSGPMGDGTLPLLSVNGTGLTGNVGAGAIVLPAWDVSATYYQDTTANGDMTFALLSVAGEMVSTNLINGDATLPLLSMAGVGMAGNVATASLTLPLLAVTADGYFDNIGNAVIELPALFGEATGHNAGVTSTPSTTIALNTRVRAVTLYDGVAANSYAQFAGMTLAATPNGIVALMGDTDLGAPIAANVVAGTSDFDAVELKRVLTGYVGYRADGDMELTLITDEHHEFIYALQPRQVGGDLHPTRVKFGRGVSGRYWQWALANRDGANFTLDSLTLVVEPRKRRI